MNSEQLFSPSVSAADKEGHEINLLDIIESSDNDIVDELELQGNIKKLYELVKKVLTHRERQIIEMRYGLNMQDEITQREIANKIGISRSYVSRIEKKALRKLRESFEKECI
jgi:RNA polymerase sporulation-specific sigma factor